VEIRAIVLMVGIMAAVQEPRLGIKNLHHHHHLLAMGTADTLHTPLLRRTWLLVLVSHRLYPAWAPSTMALAVLHLHLPYVRSFSIGDSYANET
jgi:hypothetical protein